jgi:hypothetical protein
MSARDTSRTALLAIACTALCPLADADGSGIDKIYDPYVQLLEHELEYRSLYQHDSDPALDGMQWQRLGYGQAFNEHWAGEIYAISEQQDHGDFGLDGFELELKRQLTERGEYDNDWGLLFELEHSNERNTWELANTLLVQHDWARWTGVLNAALIYEWGAGIHNEVETRLAGQLRYRRDAMLEPGLQFYIGENIQGLGPALTGMWRMGTAKSLRWNASIIFGVDAGSPDTGANLNIEYEF